MKQDSTHLDSNTARNSGNFSWDNAKYERFIAYRNEPIIDLIARIKTFSEVKHIKRVLDLGCGGGNSTAFLSEHFTNAQILGLDNSLSMLQKASTLNLKNAKFKQHDINAGLGDFESFDMIFANASIHWIKDQKRLFSDIFSALKKGAILAIQIPNDEASPFYAALREVVAHSKWQGKFNKPRAFYSLRMSEYYEILDKKTREIYLWECHYLHILEGLEEIIEWYKGSGLRAYLEQLESGEREAFLGDLRTILPTHFTPQKKRQNPF